MCCKKNRTKIKNVLMKRLCFEEGNETPELEVVPMEARDVVAQIAEAWISRGNSQASFCQFLKEAGFNVPKSTLSDWLINRRETGRALPGGNGRGRPSALTEEQVRLVVGFVLWKNHNSFRVGLVDVKDFLKKTFWCNVMSRLSSATWLLRASHLRR
jgi:hypothetical protein